LEDVRFGVIPRVGAGEDGMIETSLMILVIDFGRFQKAHFFIIVHFTSWGRKDFIGKGNLFERFF
jgi:hypothetical protein